jgi:hypothetical protein
MNLTVCQDVDLIIELGAFVRMSRLPVIANQYKDRDEDRLHCQDGDEPKVRVLIEDPCHGEEPVLRAIQSANQMKWAATNGGLAISAVTLSATT